MERTTMSIFRLYVSAAIMVSCLAEDAWRMPTERVLDTHWELVHNSTGQLAANISKFVKHWSGDEATVEKNEQVTQG